MDLTELLALILKIGLSLNPSLIIIVQSILKHPMIKPVLVIREALVSCPRLRRPYAMRAAQGLLMGLTTINCAVFALTKPRHKRAAPVAMCACAKIAHKHSRLAMPSAPCAEQLLSTPWLFIFESTPLSIYIRHQHPEEGNGFLAVW